MIVAEQVVAALEGGLVTNAVNIPTVGADDLEVLGPYIPLAAKLGRLAMELGRRRRAPAHDRGVRRARGLRHAPAHGRGAERRVPGPDRPAGQLRQRAGGRRRSRHRGGRGEAPLVARLHESRRRVAPTARASPARRSAPRTATGSSRRSASSSRWSSRRACVLLRYDDVPGVIGRVGTLFGEAGVNIANMAVSRNREGGKALMALTIDSAAPPELIDSLEHGRRRRLRHHVGDGAPGRSPSSASPRSCGRRPSTRGSRSSRTARRPRARRRGGRLRARPDRQVARVRLRRRVRARARPRRPPRRRGARSPQALGATEVRVARPGRGACTRPGSSRAASRRSRSARSRRR